MDVFFCWAIFSIARSAARFMSWVIVTVLPWACFTTHLLIAVVIVVLTFTRGIKSVVTGQAPVTLE